MGKAKQRKLLAANYGKARQDSKTSSSRELSSLLNKKLRDLEKYCFYEDLTGYCPWDYLSLCIRAHSSVWIERGRLPEEGEPEFLAILHGSLCMKWLIQNMSTCLLSHSLLNTFDLNRVTRADLKVNNLKAKLFSEAATILLLLP